MIEEAAGNIAAAGHALFHAGSIGSLGAALLFPFTFSLLLYLIGAVERRRWDGKVPTVEEYVFGGKDRKRSSVSQLVLARWRPRVLVVAVVGLGIGGLLIVIGAVSR
jgi:hypothetical protein